MKRLALVLLLSLVALSLLPAQKPAAPREFFPLKAGTYWIYKGSVGWFDAETDQPVTDEVTWRMSVLKVYRKKGLLAAIVNGFPADLDWSAGATEPKPWLIVEYESHHVYYENLGPDFDLSKLDAGDQVFDKFLVEDNFFFRWPLQKGAKFCTADAKGRDDDRYCWIVVDATARKLDSVQGAPSGEQPVFRMQYRSLPDDTTVQLVPGIGLLSYEYHHHGTVADTELQLVEFHPALESPDVQGSKP